jgi:hypothetical protein
VSKRAIFNACLVAVALLATLSAAMLAYGTDPDWGRYRHGLNLIILTQRLSGLLATLSLLCCLAVVAMIVAGRRRIFWLIILGPVLALFAHRIVSNPMRIYQILDNPTCVKADAATFLTDSDYVVGVTLKDTPYAYPYSALFRAPVVLQANHDEQYLLIWSMFANRVIVQQVDRTVRCGELQIVSMPANALLLYNGRGGQFINGVTGLTTRGEKPAGFRTPVQTYKLTWGQWKSLHPDTWVLPAAADDRQVTQPVLPRYPMSAGPASDQRPQMIAFVPTTRPIALPMDAVGAGPTNIGIGDTQLLLVRDSKNGLLKAFDRQLEDDLAPLFHSKSDAKRPAVAWEDNDSGTEWSADGRGIEGQFKGKQLQSVPVDDADYLEVMRHWFGDLQEVTPLQATGRPSQFVNPGDAKSRRRRR